VWQSGAIDIEGRITKQGDCNVRTALCEAVASLLVRLEKWTALKAWGLWIAKRTSMMNAIVVVERKLFDILHHLWIDGADFIFAKGAAVMEKRVLIDTIQD
jgi:transposase